MFRTPSVSYVWSQQVTSLSDCMLGIIQQIASDINKSKRPLFLIFAFADRKAESVWQEKNGNKTFEAGYLPLTRGKIIISHLNRATAGLPRGSSKATHSPNGNRPDRVLFCGFMANVCCHQDLMSSRTLIGFLLIAGSGKSVLSYVELFYVSILRTYHVGQLHDHRGNQYDAGFWACLSRFFLL
jgi:hypothetical protein